MLLTYWVGFGSSLGLSVLISLLIYLPQFPAKIIRRLLHVSQEQLVLQYGYFVAGSYLRELSFKLSGILRAMKKKLYLEICIIGIFTLQKSSDATTSEFPLSESTLFTFASTPLV